LTLLKLLKKNKQGSLKTKGQNILYECNGQYFSFLKGKYLEYYNNGNIDQIHIYDEIGSLMYAKKNNRKGQVQSELIATKISCTTNDLCELLSEYDNLSIHLIQNYYKYSKSLDSIYKSKTVHLVNGKKIKVEKFDKPKD